MSSKYPTFDGNDLSRQNLKAARAYYRANGLVKIAFLSAKQCDKLVVEQWKKVISRQHWTPEYKIKVISKQDGRELDVNNKDDRKEFLAAVIGPLSPGDRKGLERGWPLHRGFGACCDPAVFHLRKVWELRQDPRIYEFAVAFTGVKWLWSDVNRSIQKLPGQGDNEFLHWDFNPFFQDEEDINAQDQQVCGKMCYTTSRFICVLGSHTQEFIAEMVEEYGPHYPHVKSTDKKFGLSQEKPDPMKLIERKEEIPVGAGEMVIWHPRLLHGQMKTPIGDPVEYGNYLGFFPAPEGSREKYKETCGVDELEDRLRSYKEGNAPLLWPSFDKVQFYPKKFNNFPHLMMAYVNKLPAGDPMIMDGFTAKGVPKKYLVPIPQVDYKPPRLSKLGKKLLGLRAWKKKERVKDGDSDHVAKKRRT